MTNEEVVQAWSNGNQASTSRYGSTYRFHTNGSLLYSYSLIIGYREESGEKVVIDYTGENSRSSTTSRHVNKAKLVADKIISPENANIM